MSQNSIIITKWGTGSNAQPPTLRTGELAINIEDGKLFYGSASVVKTITASYAITAAFALNGGGGGGGGTPGGSVNDFQYNAGGGNFGGASSLTYVSSTQIKASGSFTGSFVGNLTGTASYVSGNIFNSNNLALSASYALTASYVSGNIFNSNNLALSASYALNGLPPGTSGQILQIDASNTYQLQTQLNDTAGNPSVDFESRELYDVSSIKSINYDNRELLDPSGNPALDYRLRKLIGSDGTTPTLTYDTNLVNITGSLVLTGSLLVTQSHISTVDYIDYTVNPGTLAHIEGRTYWDKDRKTLQIDTDVNNFTISAGHVSVLRGRNTNSYTLTKGMVVYISGNSGQFATFTTASWENDPNSAYTIGVIAQDINANQFGYAVTDGEITGVNTNGFAPATLLYLSSSGQYTGTKPVAPRHTVRLGQVVVASTNGILQVKVDNGYELGELHDALDNTTTSSYGDLLVKSGSLWINSKQLTGSYGLTGSLNISGSVISKDSTTLSGSVFISGSTLNPGSGHVLTYNTQSGQVFFTASSAIGGGGGGGNSIGELTGDVTAGPASSPAQSVSSTLKPNLKSGSFGITVDGAGGVISTGQKGYVTMPYSGSILSWTLLGDQAGSCNIDITKSTFAGFPTQTSITGSAPITATSVQKATSTTLTGWTSSFDVGDVFGFTIVSLSGYTRLNLFISTVKF